MVDRYFVRKGTAGEEFNFYLEDSDSDIVIGFFDLEVAREVMSYFRNRLFQAEDK